MTKPCRDCPGRHSLMCCRRIAPAVVMRRCARCDAEVAVTGIVDESLLWGGDILCQAHLDALREPVPMTKAEAQLVGIQPGPMSHKPRTELDMVADAFMIQWLCGVGKFDTNDPCDEWPVP